MTYQLSIAQTRSNASTSQETSWVLPAACASCTQFIPPVKDRARMANLCSDPDSSFHFNGDNGNDYNGESNGKENEK